jgi:hypothetical protein
MFYCLLNLNFASRSYGQKNIIWTQAELNHPLRPIIHPKRIKGCVGGAIVIDCEDFGVFGGEDGTFVVSCVIWETVEDEFDVVSVDEFEDSIVLEGKKVEAIGMELES